MNDASGLEGARVLALADLWKDMLAGTHDAEPKNEPTTLRQLVKLLDGLSKDRESCVGVTCNVWRILHMEEKRAYISGISDCLCAISRGKLCPIDSMRSAENVIRQPGNAVSRMVEAILSVTTALENVTLPKIVYKEEKPVDDVVSGREERHKVHAKIPDRSAGSPKAGSRSPMKTGSSPSLKVGSLSKAGSRSPMKTGSSPSLKVDSLSKAGSPKAGSPKASSPKASSPKASSSPSQGKVEVSKQHDRLQNTSTLRKTRSPAKEWGGQASTQCKKHVNISTNRRSSDESSVASINLELDAIASSLIEFPKLTSIENLEDVAADAASHDPMDRRRKPKDVRPKAVIKKREDPRCIWKFGHERKSNRNLISDMEEGKQTELLRRAARLTRDDVRVKSNDELHELRIHHSGIVRSGSKAPEPVASPLALPRLSKIPSRTAADEVREMQTVLRPGKDRRRTSLPHVSEDHSEKRAAAKFKMHLGNTPEYIIDFVHFIGEVFTGDLQLAFRGFDGNGNESVSFSEFLQTLTVMKYIDSRDPNKSKSAIKLLFAHLDSKHAGFLNSESFTFLVSVQESIADYDLDVQTLTPEETAVADDTAEHIKDVLVNCRKSMARRANLMRQSTNNM